MKKIFVSILFFGILCFNTSFAQAVCGIGIELLKDPYNNKVFVFKVFPNSSAQKYGLKEGSEIISIEGERLKNLSKVQILNLIKGAENTKVKLVVKNNKAQKTIEVPREKFQISSKKTSDFDFYWQKIAQKNVVIEPINQNILKNMSKEFYVEVVPTVNYWIARKVYFEYGYDFCGTYGEQVKNKCISNLVKSEIEKTKKENVNRGLLKENILENSISNNIIQAK